MLAVRVASPLRQGIRARGTSPVVAGSETCPTGTSQRWYVESDFTQLVEEVGAKAPAGDVFFEVSGGRGKDAGASRSNVRFIGGLNYIALEYLEESCLKRIR